MLDTLKSFLGLMDGGSFFRNPVKWLYVVIAVINVALPIYLLVQAIRGKMFQYLGGWDITVFIIAWIVFFAGLLCLAAFWWLRMKQLDDVTVAIDEFPSTPIVAHFVRTLGEWLGLLSGGVMFVVMLLIFILSGFSDGGAMSAFSSMSLGGDSFWSILMMPVVGFLIILFTRFLSEQIKVLVAIARNTKK